MNKAQSRRHSHNAAKYARQHHITLANKIRRAAKRLARFPADKSTRELLAKLSKMELR